MDAETGYAPAPRRRGLRTGYTTGARAAPAARGACLAPRGGIPDPGSGTRPGLGLPVGGPAINPVPRRMIARSVRESLRPLAPMVTVTVGVRDGEVLARRTLNGRLGIEGGLSILGTTGVVRPYSTAAWKASVLQGIDVAVAAGCREIVASTGGRSEAYA